MGKESIGRFVEYFSKPMNNEQILYLNNINKVITERVELYCDFITSLCYLVHDTYLGDDVIVTYDDQKAHFNWCWNKNIDNFKKEDILISNMGEHYYYYFNYFNEIFYKNGDKNKLLFNKIVEFWYNTFSLVKNKTKSEYDLFVEIYKIMNKYFMKGS
jgi:hypothetical protein